MDLTLAGFHERVYSGDEHAPLLLHADVSPGAAERAFARRSGLRPRKDATGR